MSKAEFRVPEEAIKEFAEDMVNRNLNNEITGTTEEGEIIVEVKYNKEDSKEVDALEEALEELRKQLEEEGEEEEETE